ncbi:endonuclease/exonuclease/phosphatase family protein [Candidatus Woesearchaeota archaeon]|nr:endonuclease/exonuclease/phosphatase family protein [Candidatus Woesearchaeota archaeon]
MRKISIIILSCLCIIVFYGCSDLDTVLSEINSLDITAQATKQARVINESDITGFTVAGFNIQVFGASKMEKPTAVEYLPKIISKFDIIAVQEVRDSSGEAIKELHNQLPNYQLVISERLGRTNSKEQYAIFYKKADIKSEYVYFDENDIFEREPYIVYISNKKVNFSLIVIHVKPSDAKSEISALNAVISDAQMKNSDKDFILLGDLNADCNYYDENQDILREYDWIIENEKDTTVAKNTCTYDRIITNMKYSSGGVYNYQKAYDISYEETEIISDHYPVYTVLY